MILRNKSEYKALAKYYGWLWLHGQKVTDAYSVRLALKEGCNRALIQWFHRHRKKR